MARCACLMMQKNEILVEPWIVYHGLTFGFDNLYVYDNGSTCINTKEVLERYSSVGINVFWDKKNVSDFKDKGDIFKEHIETLQLSGKYDYYFPIDCDEFVLISGESGYSTTRGEIHAYLDEMIGDDRVQVVSHQLLNIPGALNVFALIDFSKCVIPNRPVRYIDHGFHAVEMMSQTHPVKSRIVYAHLHNKPFEMLLQSSRQKLNPFVDCDDLNALSTYQGSGFHLVKYFFQSSIDYERSFAENTRVQSDGLLNILRAFCLDGFMRTWKLGLSKSGDDHRLPNCLIQGVYNRSRYLDKNRDVAESGMDPLTHYCLFGSNGRRPV